MRAAAAPAIDIRAVTEVEPNDQSEQAKLLELPAVLEGVIRQPGDVDYFRFKGKAGQLLAIEARTPCASRPQFNLRVDVLDAKAVVVLSNLHVQERKVGTESSKVIDVAPEIVGKLEKEGEYTLRVRDLTTLQGSPEHVYWVLIRPQIPHLGEIQIQPPGPVNLVPGAKQRLTLSAPPKEGFGGTFAVSVEGLPQGVRAFIGTNNSVLELSAEASAPLTGMPQIMHIIGLPLDGKMTGAAFPVGEVPVMVVKK
jgi:hypothetical protein